MVNVLPQRERRNFLTVNFTLLVLLCQAVNTIFQLSIDLEAYLIGCLIPSAIVGTRLPEAIWQFSTAQDGVLLTVKIDL